MEAPPATDPTVKSTKKHHKDDREAGTHKRGKAESRQLRERYAKLLRDTKRRFKKLGVGDGPFVGLAWNRGWENVGPSPNLLLVVPPAEVFNSRWTSVHLPDWNPYLRSPDLAPAPWLPESVRQLNLDTWLIASPVPHRPITSLDDLQPEELKACMAWVTGIYDLVSPALILCTTEIVLEHCRQILPAGVKLQLARQRSPRGEERPVPGAGTPVEEPHQHGSRHPHVVLLSSETAVVDRVQEMLKRSGGGINFTYTANHKTTTGCDAVVLLLPVPLDVWHKPAFEHERGRLFDFESRSSHHYPMMQAVQAAKTTQIVVLYISVEDKTYSPSPAEIDKRVTYFHDLHLHSPPVLCHAWEEKKAFVISPGATELPPEVLASLNGFSLRHGSGLAGCALS